MQTAFDADAGLNQAHNVKPGLWGMGTISQADEGGRSEKGMQARSKSGKFKSDKAIRDRDKFIQRVDPS